MPGVYISYPFCNQKCTFCNFASDVYTAESQAAYNAALLAEVRTHEWKWPPETVYFGGGTPSLMPLDLLGAMMREIPQEHLTEVTLECAPGTVTGDKIAGWLRAGVNRVSLGVQSFDETELRHTGRRHTAATVKEDIALLRTAGIDNISVDLIAGLPHQTRETWTHSLDLLEQLSVPHVSIYVFEIDEESRLGREILLGGQRYSAGFLPSEDLAAELYRSAVSRLCGMGLPRYEISNFARPGGESRHNLKYWLREPYLGFGLDAHSFDGAFRWSNPDQLDAYLTTNPRSKTLSLQQVNSSEEHFFVGLRMMNGIKPTAEEWGLFAGPIARWTHAGMLEQQGDVLRLTEAGVLVSNEIFQEFLLV